jgi:hypothetical protein
LFSLTIRCVVIRKLPCRRSMAFGRRGRLVDLRPVASRSKCQPHINVKQPRLFVKQIVVDLMSSGGRLFPPIGANGHDFRRGNLLHDIDIRHQSRTRRAMWRQFDWHMIKIIASKSNPSWWHQDALGQRNRDCLAHRGLMDNVGVG